MDPRILLLTDSEDRLASLCDGLDAIGWRTVTARTVMAAQAVLHDFAIEAVLLQADHPEALTAPSVLRQTAMPRRLSVVSIGKRDDQVVADQVDMSMSHIPHAAQAALRVEQLFRAAIAEEEFELRQATLAGHGTTLEVAKTDQTPLRVLAAGVADKRFLALANAVSAAGAEIIAAPTPYTAFDYLHESAFDAAVLWGGPDHAPALSIAAGMKRNTRLYHIPIVLYLREEGQIDPTDLYNRGFADIAAAETPEDETAERILGLAQTHRRQVAIRKALEGARGSGLMDSSTGLFTRELFAAHLKRLSDGSRLRRRHLSICVLRVSDHSDTVQARVGGWLDRAMPQIGTMISRLVRVEDTAARLAPEVFALALPATPGPAARLAAERIAAVIGCTAFDAGSDKSPFVVQFDMGVAEMSPSESPASALERASSDMSQSAAS